MASVPIPADDTAELPEIPEVHVELFGVPRLLARQEVVAARGATLGELGQSLRHACPALAGTVLDGASGWPLDGYIFVVDERFTHDRQTGLTSDSTVLLVSSVAGG
jgi:molybdopterin converting factor small subunit